MVKAFDNLNWVLKIILQLFLGWPISVIYRIVKGLETNNTTTLIVGIVTIFIPILWVVDLITIIISNDITVLA